MSQGDAYYQFYKNAPADQSSTRILDPGNSRESQLHFFSLARSPHRGIQSNRYIITAYVRYL